MSFNPEDYPGEYPDEWYDTFLGTMVSNMSVIKAMLSRDRLPIETNGEVSRGTPVVGVTLGEWDGDTWIGGIYEGEGILMGLEDSDGENPTVIIGDYKGYVVRDVTGDSELVERADVKYVSLRRIGSLMGVEMPPEMYEDEN